MLNYDYIENLSLNDSSLIFGSPFATVLTVPGFGILSDLQGWPGLYFHADLRVSPILHRIEGAGLV